MNKGKHFTRVCLDCGKVMENVAGNLRFCASCRRERHNQYCRDYRAHNEKPARVMWYTVWDAKTGDLLASGTSEMHKITQKLERLVRMMAKLWAQEIMFAETMEDAKALYERCPRLLKEKVKAILIKSGFEEITQ